MLDNCTYNKIKLMHEVSSMLWFIQRHGYHDAKAAGDMSCLEVLQELEEDLQKTLGRLRQYVCAVTH
jgi:hypothetical protein